MARWLQSAGLQHLASPHAASAPDQRVLPNLLLQGYGPQTVEEKQKLYMLLRSLNFNGESAPEPYTPTAQAAGGAGPAGPTDSFYSPELKGDFGAGLLDLHAMDDTELLSEHVVSEPFEPSPFMPKGFDDDDDMITDSQQSSTDNSFNISVGEKGIATKESNVAKIKVVVRKRPLNKKEISRDEDDIVTVHDNMCLTVHEPKLKVDLTAYVEKHEFCFDAVLDEQVNNDEVYRVTVEPIIPTIFQRTKATCFAYGQTGSGKTYTMQPLPLRAAEDMVRLLNQPLYHNQNFKLWLSYFEIYGGKLFDLLCDRRKLCMREDGRQQVCIVGLQEFEVSDVQIVKEFIDRGNAARSTGSTGANEESSRSHAILQLAVKKHKEVIDTRRQRDSNEPKNGKVVGKISFIDLAGSERGADTTDNDRQTRIEGAEINKSLLALKECIRALDNDQLHIPFRGSKLTEVLRDSFVGNSRTVMISCISPNAGSCEHTLNTLRYADRVKSLSKSGNSRKDQAAGSFVPPSKESASSSYPLPVEADDTPGQNPDFRAGDMSNWNIEKNTSNSALEPERNSFSMNPSYNQRGRESGPASVTVDERNSSSMNPSYNQRGRESGAASVTVDERNSSSMNPSYNQRGRESRAASVTVDERNSFSMNPSYNQRVRESRAASISVDERNSFSMNPGYNQRGRESGAASVTVDERNSFSMNPSYNQRGKERAASATVESERVELNNQGGFTSKLQSRRKVENVTSNSTFEPERNSSSMIPSYNQRGRGENGVTSGVVEREGVELKSNQGSVNNKMEPDQNFVDIPEGERVPKVSPPRRKVSKEDKAEKLINWSKKDGGSEATRAGHKQLKQQRDKTFHGVSRQYEKEDTCTDGEINAILEEEEALIAAHRKEIENTMEIVREEMNLLAEVDQPGSLIDNYVTQLSFLLSRKAAGLVSLQARLARFQHRLKEQEILSRKKASRS